MVENQNIKAIETLSSAMQGMVDKKMDNIARDRTRVGMVKLVNSNGTFNVLIDGREYSGVQAYGDGDIVVNELVKVIYPDNNPTNMFILPKPSRRLATPTQSGWITPDEKNKLNNILYDSDNALTLTVGVGKMFTTIQSAIDSLPKNIDSVTITINIDSGTYNENVVISGFYGTGAIYIYGTEVAVVGDNPNVDIYSLDLQSIHLYISINRIRITSYILYSDTDKTGIRVNQCKYASLQYVFVASSLTAGGDASIYIAGGSLVAIGTNSKLGTTTQGLYLTSLSKAYATGTLTFGTHTYKVYTIYGGTFSTPDKIDTYVTLYGGMMLSGNGLKGSSFTLGGSSYGNITAGYDAQYYAASGLCFMAFKFNVTASIGTGNSLVIANLTSNLYPPATLTALSVFRSDETVVKAYVNQSGEIAIRTNTTLSSGTLYIAGSWQTIYR